MIHLGLLQNARSSFKAEHYTERTEIVLTKKEKGYLTALVTQYNFEKPI
jgi:hypothetical protein